MRLFLASLLNASNRSFYGRTVSELVAASDRDLRPVPPDSQHLTHLFLGNQGEGSEGRILALLENLSVRPAVPVRLGAARILRGRGGPRLVYVPVVAGGRRLEALGAGVRAAIARDFPEPAAGRPTPPHVTIARFRRGSTRSAGRMVEALLRESGLAATERNDQVEAVQLFSSVLGRGGAVYDKLGEVRLLGGPV